MQRVSGVLVANERGRRMNRTATRKELVLRELRRALYDRADGWVSGPTLCHPTVGGSEGLRRVRELRADGYVIEMRKMYRGLSTRQYRIVE